MQILNIYRQNLISNHLLILIMTLSFHALLEFSSQSITPLSLLRQDITAEDFIAWRKYLLTEQEIIRLKLYKMMLGASSESEKRLYMTTTQKQLVTLSDLVSRYLHRERKIWEHHRFADQIKVGYLFTLNAIQELLHFLSIGFKEFFDNTVRFTQYELRSIVPQLRNCISGLKAKLALGSVDARLAEILVKGLIRHLNKSTLSPSIAAYIDQLSEEIIGQDNLSTEALVGVLIRYNFNLPEFYLYLIEPDLEDLEQIEGLHEQRELVLQKKDRMKRTEQQPGLGLNTEDRALREDLIDFLADRAVYLDELLSLRRQSLVDLENSGNAFRILVNLSVPQLALFFRLQMEMGVLAKEKVTKVFNFVAQHFYTEKTVFISAQNLLRRSTVIDFASVLKVWDLLAEMMDWLDQQFSVRNYQRSSRA